MNYCKYRTTCTHYKYLLFSFSIQFQLKQKHLNSKDFDHVFDAPYFPPVVHVWTIAYQQRVIWIAHHRPPILPGLAVQSHDKWGVSWMHGKDTSVFLCRCHEGREVNNLRRFHGTLVGLQMHFCFFQPVAVADVVYITGSWFKRCHVAIHIGGFIFQMWIGLKYMGTQHFNSLFIWRTTPVMKAEETRGRI